MGRVQIVEGTLTDLNHVYVQMKTDFPAAERKSRPHIRQLMLQGRYRLLIARDPARRADVGYAFLFEPESPKVLWLDYMAVHPRFQNEGYGTELFKEILLWGKNHLGVMLELDRPGEGHGQAWNQERRIAFFRRLGAEPLEVAYQLPTVSGSQRMDLYFRPSPGTSLLTKEQIRETIQAAYDYIHTDMPHRGAILRSFIDTIQDHRVQQEAPGAVL